MPLSSFFQKDWKYNPIIYMTKDLKHLGNNHSVDRLFKLELCENGAGEVEEAIDNH